MLFTLRTYLALVPRLCMPSPAATDIITMFSHHFSDVFNSVRAINTKGG